MNVYSFQYSRLAPRIHTHDSRSLSASTMKAVQAGRVVNMNDYRDILSGGVISVGAVAEA